MTAVTKTVRFDAAHMLSGHPGRCRNLHGHTYRVDVTVAGAGDGGMVMDFGELKRRMEAAIGARFDHAFVYDTRSEAERAVASVVEGLGLRTVALPFRSTSENLARHFFETLLPDVPGLVAVRVWETADNCAEYSGGPAALHW